MSNIWYSYDKEKVLSILKTRLSGLTEVEVKRKQEEGLNKIETKNKVGIFSIFIKQFKSPLIYILIFAGVVALSLGEIIDGSIILGIILLNAFIGTFQEGKAQNILEALSNAIKGKATVLRDGKELIVSDTDVVVGDILILKDGDIISGDARILESNSLKVSESSLTGESTPVQKIDDVIKTDGLSISDQQNMVFKGTYVLSGYAKVVVVSVGKDSQIGVIADKLNDLHTDVPLQENINNFSKIIIYVVVSVSIILFIAGILRGTSIQELFFVIVAVSVSAIPESLPVVVTLVLATGVWRMSKKNTLIKRLQAVEALGQANVLALDKTGTITKNQMMLEKVFVNDTMYEISGDGYSPEGEVLLNGERVNYPTHPGIGLMARTGALTSVGDFAYNDEKKDWVRTSGDPTEVSMLVFGKKVGFSKKDLEKQYEKVSEIPFDLHTKHHTTINIIDGKKFLSTAGSPEVILRHSTRIWKNGESKEIDNTERERIEAVIQNLSVDGYRILALAGNDNPPENVSDKNLPELTLFGFIGIADVIREGVSDSVAAAQEAGMDVVMITGDHKITAQTIAQKVGIYREGDNILSGLEIENMTDEELSDAIRYCTVFSRVTPEHKLRLIKAFQANGNIVAMTGDGINDALSLVAADLGVAMGKVGTEVAREASDIILLDDNFGNIISAAEEGRNMYQIIRKAILYLVSTNLGEMAVVSIAIIFGLPLPLLATQILWLNMVTDTFLVLALTLEPKSRDLMKERFIKPSKWLLDKELMIRSVLIGGVMTIGTLILFVHYIPHGMIKTWTVSLTMLTVFQWYNLFNVRSSNKSVLQQNIFTNPYLLLSVLFAIGIHVFAITNGFMQKLLNLTTLTLEEWVIILTVGLSVILVEEIRKLIYRVRS